jgi:hypothetical protein
MSGTKMSSDDCWQVFHLIASYARCVDEPDIDGYVHNFVPDGVIEHSNGSCTGHDEIRKWVTGLLEQKRIGPDSHFRHVLGLPVISPAGDDRCSARTYVMIPSKDTAGAVSLPLVLTYVDTCVKHEGQWLFEKRIIQA